MVRRTPALLDATSFYSYSLRRRDDCAIPDFFPETHEDDRRMDRDLLPAAYHVHGQLHVFQSTHDSVMYPSPRRSCSPLACAKTYVGKLYGSEEAQQHFSCN